LGNGRVSAKTSSPGTINNRPPEPLAALLPVGLLRWAARIPAAEALLAARQLHLGFGSLWLAQLA